MIIILFSCTGNDKERITRIVSEWQGKKIIFPENLIFTLFGKDTVNYTIPQSKYKVLVYVDSTGCTSCKLKLEEWKKFIYLTDSLSHKNISFLFFFHPKSEKSMQSILQIKKLNIPICIDVNDKLNQLNEFSKDIIFQSFLLDENNKVLVVGNPIYSHPIKKLYIREIIKNWQ